VPEAEKDSTQEGNGSQRAGVFVVFGNTQVFISCANKNATRPFPWSMEEFQFDLSNAHHVDGTCEYCSIIRKICGSVVDVLRGTNALCFCPGEDEKSFCIHARKSVIKLVTICLVIEPLERGNYEKALGCQTFQKIRITTLPKQYSNAMTDQRITKNSSLGIECHEAGDSFMIHQLLVSCHIYTHSLPSR
jgi:hypothetical protein